jgi:hypothetical protein
VDDEMSDYIVDCTVLIVCFLLCRTASHPRDPAGVSGRCNRLFEVSGFHTKSDSILRQTRTEVILVDLTNLKYKKHFAFSSSEDRSTPRGTNPPRPSIEGGASVQR